MRLGLRAWAAITVLAAIPLPFLLLFHAASRDELLGWFASYFVIAALAFAWGRRGPRDDAPPRRWRFDRSP